MNSDPTSLDRLHDVIMPAPDPWWPPAPGWYALLVVAGILLAVALVRLFIRWQKNRYRREALAELKNLSAHLATPGLRAEAVTGMAVLLKRAAVSAWPRETVASLNGPAWFAFLDRTGSTDQFSAGFGNMLESVAYDPSKAAVLAENDLQELPLRVRHWLANHRKEEEC